MCKPKSIGGLSVWDLRLVSLELIGSFMHAMVWTRLTIGHVIDVVSQFLSNHSKNYWQAVKLIIRYLKGSYRVCLCFRGGDYMLDGYTNVDMADDIGSRKFTFGYMMNLV